jgi:hypothetical protein
MAQELGKVVKLLAFYEILFVEPIIRDDIYGYLYLVSSLSMLKEIYTMSMSIVQSMMGQTCSIPIRIKDWGLPPTKEFSL